MTKRQFMTVKQKRDDGQKSPFRIWLIGQAGSSKTSQCCYLANAGYKVILIDMNGEHNGCFDDFLTESGAENLIVISLYPENLEAKGKKATDGSLSEQLDEVLDQLKDEGQLDDPDTFLVIDGITDWSRDIFRLSFTTNKEGKEDSQSGYRIAQNEFQRQVTKVTAYTRNCSLVIIGHLTMQKMEGSAKEVPLIECITKNFADKLLSSAGISNLFVTEKTVSRDDVRTYNVIVKPTYKYEFVKNVLVNDPDMPEIVESKDFLSRFVSAARNGKWV